LEVRPAAGTALKCALPRISKQPLSHNLKQELWGETVRWLRTLVIHMECAMRIRELLVSGVAATALLALASTGASAESKTDRAKKAIAAAQAKVDAAAKVGAAGDTPRMLADAESSLRDASLALSKGRENEAVADANHAADLADTALNVSQRNKQEDLAAKEGQVRMNAAAAAQAQAATAQAQQQAAVANTRADAATQAAQSAAADAAAARNAAAEAAAAPAPATTVVEQTETRSAPATTVTTTTAPKRVVHKRTVRHRVTHPSVVKKTTTITTQQ